MNNDLTLEEMFSEFLTIYKFLNHAKIAEVLGKQFDDGTDSKIRVYELSDGIRSTRDIQKLVGLSPTTITTYWKQWALSGIVIPAERKGRYKAAFDLREYGLSVTDEIDQGDEA